MKKLLLSLAVCSALINATEHEHMQESETSLVNSAGAVLSAAQITNTCLVMPIVSQIIKKQLINVLSLDNSFLAVVGGVSVGFLASVATEQLINLSVLNASKTNGHRILNAARNITEKYIPTGLIGFLAFLASIA